ncbi:hypothetical protein A9G11_06485 [Gilliamella sp. wkB108]|uniref:hypothetical protein n=1 Tax=Gilliamella sp. wkB108 TaxID=3120256 RepID=UPI00080EB8E4|nr:hypothetical protein [Gilliamella apicola]OCG23024.1 hypothetical protein A9G11_06485 [Gilliamella apicola]
MKTVYKLLGSSLLIFSSSGYASDPATVASQFEAALLCQAEAIDARKPEVVKSLNEQNIEVKNLDEELIELEYHFAKPLQILNVTVSRVRYEGDSGSYFFATAKGDMDAFAKSIGAKPIPENLQEMLLWADIGEYYKYAEPVTVENPYPNTVIIGRNEESKPGEFYFGCEKFDY